MSQGTPNPRLALPYRWSVGERYRSAALLWGTKSGTTTRGGLERCHWSSLALVQAAAAPEYRASYELWLRLNRLFLELNKVYDTEKSID